MPLLQPTMLSSTLVSKLISFLSFLSLKATSTCSLKILFFTCLVSSVAVASESDVDHVKYHSSDVIEVKHLIQNSSFTCFTKVEVVNLEPSDYEMGPSYTKEYSLVGKDKKKEKLRVMNKQSLFNKNFKVASENVKMCEIASKSRCPSVTSLDARMRLWLPRRKNGYFHLQTLCCCYNLNLRSKDFCYDLNPDYLSGDSVLLQWQACLRSRFHRVHLRLCRGRKHGHLSYVEKGGCHILLPPSCPRSHPDNASCHSIPFFS